MKAAQFEEYGNPAEVLSCVELPAPGTPSGTEIIVRMEAAPINPADLLMIAGEVPTLYKRLVSMLAEGKLHVSVAARYPLAQVKEAVEHAGRGGRDGEVLLIC